MTGTGDKSKMWASGAGILGIILVVCGFLSQTKQEDCKASHYTWASVIIGFIMLMAGFLAIMHTTTSGMAADADTASMGGNM